MSRSNKFLLSVAVLAVTTCGVRPSQAHAARLADDHGIFCVIDVTVESRDQAGLVVGTEVYSKEFFLREGESFSDDFSTRTRFKFLLEFCKIKRFATVPRPSRRTALVR